MSTNAIFGLTILMNVLALAIVTKVYLWLRLRAMPRRDALIALVVPHTFRFIGLSFLVPGVVSPSLSHAFASPAAYGDLVAAILAGIATLALAARASWADYVPRSAEEVDASIREMRDEWAEQSRQIEELQEAGRRARQEKAPPGSIP